MTNSHAIFGYGSLIDLESREKTDQHETQARPVIADGVHRSWCVVGSAPGFDATFVGAKPRIGAKCNGVLIPVSSKEVEEFDEREKDYTLERVPPEDFTFLDGAGPDPNFCYWYFRPREEHSASAEAPIVQSYVDVMLVGCLEIERDYPLAQQSEFARMLLTTTDGWSKHWVNDRIYPRRAAATLPQAHRIDALIASELTELFAQIRIE